jgi:uncharacterized protein involved in exopolysaccharide biosynthesis
MSENIENKPVKMEDEIDLVEVFKKIWTERKTIYKLTAICFVIGLIVSLGTPREYKSEVTLLVETGTSGGSMSALLQQFGGLAGFNLGGTGSGTDALRPDLYPDVIKSTPFLLEVLEQKVTESKYDSTLSVNQYLERYTRPSLLSILMGYTIGLPSKIIGAIKGKPKVKVLRSRNQDPRPLKLTPEQSTATSALVQRIKAKEGESNNTLVISVEMQDPLVAAQLTDSVVRSLTNYITEYRTQKAKTDLQFVATSHAEAEVKYKQTQQALATYTDQNKNVILASSRTEEQRLQAEYNLAFNIYNTLSQQLEQAKLRVQQETPVFKVLNPAQVPLQKSKPKTSLILVAMVFLGGFAGVGVVFVKMVYQNIKVKNSNING